MGDANAEKFKETAKIIQVPVKNGGVGVLVGKVFMFKKDAKKYTDGDYLVRIINSEDVAIYGYLGSDSNIVIPAEIDGYNVTKIDSGAFKDSKITSVIFSSSLTIDTGAFVNCTKLSVVISTHNISVKENAFQNCPNVYLNIPNRP